MPLQQRDERQKQPAIETVLVQFARRQVRSRHHYNAELEQPREQAAEDHGVGNVGDVKLVEAQQPGFLGDGRRGAQDRILFGQRAVLDLLPIAVHALVHVGHEFVKMHAAFALHHAGREEQIHQHGLAAADFAVDVKPFQRRAGLLAFGEQPAERRRLARHPALIETVRERRHLRRQHRLAGIGLNFSGGDERRVARAEGVRHGNRTSDDLPEAIAGDRAWRERDT